jgi:hypothetical protein
VSLSCARSLARARPSQCGYACGTSAWLSYRSVLPLILHWKQMRGLAAPASIQNNSGLPQGPVHPFGGMLKCQLRP